MATIRVTREELYEQVWATPMSTLASRYGISDVALAKTCRRMNVPRPGRGYWARLAAHVKVKRPSLPKATSPQDGWLFLNRVDDPVPKSAPVKAPEVRVADSLHGAHEAVQKLGSLLQRAKVDEFDRLVIEGNGRAMLAVTVATHRRALLLLDALLKSLASRGHLVALTRTKGDAGSTASLSLAVSEVKMEATLVERLDRRERPRTEEEQRSSDFMMRLRDRPLKPPSEQFASGRLQLLIVGISGPRCSWSDGKTPLEGHLGRVIVALEAEAVARHAAHKAAERRRIETERLGQEQAAEADRQRREREAEQRRQDELAAHRRHQRALSRDLRGMARRWATAFQVRAFLDAVEVVVPTTDRGEGFRAWLHWASTYADALDPLTKPYKISKPLEPDLSSDDAIDTRDDPVTASVDADPERSPRPGAQRR